MALLRVGVILNLNVHVYSDTVNSVYYAERQYGIRNLPMALAVTAVLLGQEANPRRTKNT